MRLSLKAVRFVVEAFAGPFELCHCSRCREVSGSAFVSGIGVAPDRYIFVDDAASWDEITNSRPQCTERDVIKMRKAEWKEKLG